MEKLFLILVLVYMVAAGCETITNVEAQRKIQQYDAHYVPEEHGWCAGREIPQEDRWILDCKYGYMSCEE